MEPGLGDFLKGERERKGRSLDYMVMTTRLRRHFIEALENEDWKVLPAQVFVRGFIRSYAQALDLDERRALDLYEEAFPQEKELPQPLVAPGKTKKKWVAILLSLLVVAAVLVYLWTDLQKVIPEKVETLSPGTEETATILLEQEKGPVESRDVSNADVKEVIPPSGRKGAIFRLVAPKQEEPGPLDEQVIVPAEQIADAQDEERVPVPPDPEPVPQVSNVEESPSGDSGAGPALFGGDLVLTGIVRMRTYVRIYIDDRPLKEYIFRPGSRPQWTGSKGFDILVGNAAGIEFDLNGKMISDLGGLGKVVRIRLPEGFESKLYEE